jgi:hypothetical protein
MYDRTVYDGVTVLGESKSKSITIIIIIIIIIITIIINQTTYINQSIISQSFVETF